MAADKNYDRDETPDNDGVGDNDLTFEQAWKKHQEEPAATPSAQQTRIVSAALNRIEISRRDLAALYAEAEGGTIVEIEVGNALVKLRVAAQALRKALGNVAQMRLNLGAGPASGGGSHERH